MKYTAIHCERMFLVMKTISSDEKACTDILSLTSISFRRDTLDWQKQSARFLSCKTECLVIGIAFRISILFCHSIFVLPILPFTAEGPAPCSREKGPRQIVIDRIDPLAQSLISARLVCPFSCEPFCNEWQDFAYVSLNCMDLSVKPSRASPTVSPLR
jgi:hypothetical protein